MRNVFKPAAILLLICAATTLILASAYQTTKPIIAERAQADRAAAKRAVMPGADSFRPIDEAELKARFVTANAGEEIATIRGIDRAYRGSSFVGTVYTAFSRGYDAAGVKLTIGIDVEGKVLGIRIGEQKETPGLGTNVLSLEGPYMKQYVGLKPKTALALVKNKAAGAKAEDIDAVVGATITSRSVFRAVVGALSCAAQFTNEGALP